MTHEQRRRIWDILEALLLGHNCPLEPDPAPDIADAIDAIATVFGEPPHADLYDGDDERDGGDDYDDA